MMRRIFVNLVAVTLVSLMGAACQTLDANWSSTAMPSSNLRVSPPAGFISFCLRYPDQCQTDKDEPQIVELSDENWKVLRDVNYSVNRSIKFQDDAEHFGRHEYWDIATDGYGDCDDYVLTKRKALIDAGFPALALRVAIVRTYSNIGHAVLSVSTDQGDYVLDNRTAQIHPWEHARYNWISRQDAQDPMRWVSLRAGYPTLARAESEQPVLVSVRQGSYD
jgi:predicted transglutaminase-like cysteine proteinase